MKIIIILSDESYGSNTNNNNGMDICNDFLISSEPNDGYARDESTNENVQILMSPNVNKLLNDDDVKYV